MNEPVVEPWRIGVAVGLFALLVALGVWQLWTSGSARRLQEYGFLLYAGALAIAYAVVHDQVTVTLSPEYFLFWKGLEGDPRPLRWTSALVAVQSSWWVGVLGGAVLLVANNPRRRGVPPRLPLRRLMAIALLPTVCAAVMAAICGLVDAGGLLNRDVPFPPLTPDRLHWFRVVWSVHIGSYAGAAVGTLVAVALVESRRRSATRTSVGPQG